MYSDYADENRFPPWENRAFWCTRHTGKAGGAGGRLASSSPGCACPPAGARGVLAFPSYPPPPQAAKRAIRGNQKALMEKAELLRWLAKTYTMMISTLHY